ncbi:hypothetical protein skT53_11080 [Effusibacillus dendaii]|uniref:Uncharacterized protein n=1 Tax=Effusibacillus dendaii TaxID=2743772 RepID=A0A7I8D7I6_9BACL|nr:hypothetical protein skT53_11080 [Effusibacillus dendaii]
MVILFLEKYHSLKLRCKIINAMIICTLIKLVTLMIYLSLTDKIELLFNNVLVKEQERKIRHTISVAGLCTTPFSLAGRKVFWNLRQTGQEIRLYC